jgi:cell division protein FtsQ
MPTVAAASMLFFVGGLAAAHHLLSQPGRLPLRVIEIKGEFRQLDRPAIEKVVVDAIDGGFFSCDMNKLRMAVLAMPWVDDVSVRRSWPDRLRMVVTEQVPLARWGADSLINLRGGVFRPASIAPFDGLVRLSGPAGSEQRVVAFYQRVVAGARIRGLQLREVELDRRRHWWLRFEQDLTVSLGREAVEHRLAQFFRVYPSLVTEPLRRPERIDMRYEHGFAVRWRDEAADGADNAPGMSEDRA